MRMSSSICPMPLPSGSMRVERGPAAIERVVQQQVHRGDAGQVEALDLAANQVREVARAPPRASRGPTAAAATRARRATTPMLDEVALVAAARPGELRSGALRHRRFGRASARRRRRGSVARARRRPLRDGAPPGARRRARRRTGTAALSSRNAKGLISGDTAGRPPPGRWCPAPTRCPPARSRARTSRAPPSADGSPPRAS